LSQQRAPRTEETRRSERPRDGAARPAARVVHSDAIRVLCVDDHAVLVEGLKAQFAIKAGLEVVGQLPSADRLVEEVERLCPEVVIMDIEMPGPDAFEMADRLKRAFPDVRVVVLSAHVRDSYISASYRSGVCAYFTKSDELEDIVSGIHEVMRARPDTFLLGPRVRERCTPAASAVAAGEGGAPTAATSSGAAPVTLMSSLTSRENEILRLIGKGLGRSEIAAELCRSVKTIDGHQKRMMSKLGLTARNDLVRLAIREGLAEA
jgi:DNA-binding NarL/FixJ family response regulator